MRCSDLMRCNRIQYQVACLGTMTRVILASLFSMPTKKDTGVPCNGTVSHIRDIADQGSTRNFYLPYMSQKPSCAQIKEQTSSAQTQTWYLSEWHYYNNVFFLMTHLFSLSMKLINIIMEEVITFLWMVTLYSHVHVIVINCFKSFCFTFKGKH